MKTIPLTQGQFALVDDADFDWLNQWKWWAQWKPQARTFYVMRKTSRANGMVRHVIQMHRLILGLERGDQRQGDHKNGNGLDNQRDNIRIATASQNAANKRQQKSKSGYKGVWFHPAKGKWRAALEKDGKTIHAGYHDTPEKAHDAYLEAAKEHFGEFARLA